MSRRQSVVIDGIEYQPVPTKPGGRTPLHVLVKSRRKALGLTLEEAAVKAKISRSALWDVENKGHADPRRSTLCGISEALGISADELLDAGP